MVSLKTGNTLKATYYNEQHIVSFKLLISKPMEKSNNEVMITSNAIHNGRVFKESVYVSFLKKKKEKIMISR